MTTQNQPKDNKPIAVFIIDHNYNFLTSAVQFLQRQPNLNVTGVILNQEKVLAQAQSLSPDIILIDIDMPGSYILDIISELRDTLPLTKIIVLSLLSTTAYRQAAIAAGADEFLAKTSLINDLMPTIGRVLSQAQTD